MVNKKISKMFNLEVESDNDGSIVVPASIFIKNPDALDDIKSLITDEALAVGQPFFFSTVAINAGIKVTWAKDFRDCIPTLDQEEALQTEGLTYIIRKVG